MEKGGPAEKAGVEAGDIILKFEGKQVTSSQDLPRLVGATKPGSKASLQIWRAGSHKDLSVVVGEMPDDRSAQRPDRRSPEKPAAAANRLGLVLSDLTEERKRATRLQEGAQVDEVRGVAKADVQAGDIIIALIAKGQTTEIKSAEQFNKLLGQLDKTAILTLQLRRGENNVFATFRGEAATQ